MDLIYKEKLAISVFIERSFRWEDFSDVVYKALYGKFSHIAHIDREGFYWEWFTCDRDCPSCKQSISSHPGRWAEYVLSFGTDGQGENSRFASGRIRELSESEKWIQEQVRIHYRAKETPKEEPKKPTEFHCACGLPATEVMHVRSMMGANGRGVISVRYSCSHCGETVTVRPFDPKTGGPKLLAE
jgi:hypothetical protein